MFLAASLLTLFFPLSITGSPVEVRNSVITLPLTRRLNFSNGTIDFLQHDKARLAAFKGYNTHDRRADSVPVKSTFLEYSVAVGIGSPPTTYNLVVDTGSPITWVGASTPYVRTDTSIDSGRTAEVKYGFQAVDIQSSFSGPIFYDTVTLGDGLTVIWFPLGVASTWPGFNGGEDGILGIGPEDLTSRTIKDDPDETIPNFTDYLHLQRKISRNVVGIFFQPVTREPDSQFGELTFGGTDSTKHVAYTPITTTHPASRYWGINQRITYGRTRILDATAGIVDTGCTFLYIASDAYANYQAATGATVDQATGLLRISISRYSILQNLDFHIGGQIFSLTADAQIWPRSLNTKLTGGVVGAIYLIVQNIGTHFKQGPYDFINGYTFIQRFYTVLDRSTARVGFAKTQFTDATTNLAL
ncbi:aspartic peptidase domain-containing protein [Suillus spraguei]|nr:aspartic peptidase domain-containing protein [Suillus spraguei]